VVAPDAYTAFANGPMNYAVGTPLLAWDHGLYLHRPALGSLVTGRHQGIEAGHFSETTGRQTPAQTATARKEDGFPFLAVAISNALARVWRVEGLSGYLPPTCQDSGAWRAGFPIS
jgi:hypothetical protein